MFLINRHGDGLMEYVTGIAFWYGGNRRWFVSLQRVALDVRLTCR